MDSHTQALMGLVDQIIKPTKPKHYASVLVGKTISNVRALTATEVEDMAWFPNSDPTTVVEFTDGTYAVVMCDPEGNGSGFLDIGTY